MNLAGVGGPAYDYVLAVGPSRSGTTFLYRALNAHPGFWAPTIKEAHYYRSARRLARALAGLRGSGAMLLDVADTAWSDPGAACRSLNKPAGAPPETSTTGVHAGDARRTSTRPAAQRMPNGRAGDDQANGGMGHKTAARIALTIATLLALAACGA